MSTPSLTTILGFVQSGDLAAVSSVFSTCLPEFQQQMLSEMLPDESGGATRWSLLHSAAFHGHAAIVELLLEKGAKLESKDVAFNGSPLAWSAYKNHYSVCKILVEKGANIAAKNIQGMIPFELLALENKKRPEWINLLKAPLADEGIAASSSTTDSNNMDIDVVATDDVPVPPSSTTTSATAATLSRKASSAARKKISAVVAASNSKEGSPAPYPSQTPTNNITSASATPVITKPIVEFPHPYFPSGDKVNLLSSIGMVSNDFLLKKILPSSAFGHCLQVGPAVKSVNIRVTLAQQYKTRCLMRQNGKALKMTRDPLGENGHIVDYCAFISEGMNSFEVVLMSENLMSDCFAVFVQKTS